MSVPFGGISRIVVRSMNGDDFVDFRLTGALTQALELQIDLGDGNDTANLDFTAGIAAPLKTTLYGGAGADDVSEAFGDASAKISARTRLGSGDDSLLALFSGTLSGSNFMFDANGNSGDDIMLFDGSDLNIASGTTLDLRLYEGAGAGEISVDYQGQLDGTLRLIANGGFGNDRIDANLTTTAGSTGKLKALVHGWSGNDELTLQVVNSSGSSALVSALFDGGSGQDGYFATANVIKRNAEVAL